MHMRHPFVILTALLLLIATEVVVLFYSDAIKENLSIPNITVNSPPVMVDSLKAGDAVSSPMAITGQARGSWFFEGSFPVTVVDWDGLIIGNSQMRAKGDWMTTSYVPFEGVVSFTKPANSTSGSYDNRGAIIFKKDNPSGLPQNDASMEIPVTFQ